MAKHPHRGTTLDSLLEQDGTLGAFQAQAIKEVIAWQLAEAMKDRNLTKTRLAALMQTSRSQVNRMLDPQDGNVTLQTLQRAAVLVGRRVQVELL
jgi:antitoxin HicB